MIAGTILIEDQQIHFHDDGEKIVATFGDGHSGKTRTTNLTNNQLGAILALSIGDEDVGVKDGVYAELTALFEGWDLEVVPIP